MPSASVGLILPQARPVPAWRLNLWAATAAFAAYFAAYAFRKPFLAAEFSGLESAVPGLTAKTVYVLTQVIGYALSKYVGVRVCTEVARRRLPYLMVGLIGTAEAGLLGFALLPSDLKPAAMFANGLALGMVWGTIVRFLEGRRSSDFLLAVLCSSYVVSSGVVKDVGRHLVDGLGVPEVWMPAVVGLLFLGPFLLAVRALSRLPQPTAGDAAERSARRAMSPDARRDFLRRQAPGLLLLFAVYLLLTACRDFRDNYGIEILARLGYADTTGVFTKTELPTALAVVGSLGALNLIRRNEHALLGAFGLMIIGVSTVGASTWLLDAGRLSGIAWMTLTGLGVYLAYTPYNAVLFDRLWASTRSPGTAVFAIYAADAVGYTGSVGVQLYKDLWAADSDRLEYFRWLTYSASVFGFAALAAAAAYFHRQRAHS